MKLEKKMKFENFVSNDESSFPYDDALDFFITQVRAYF